MEITLVKKPNAQLEQSASRRAGRQREPGERATPRAAAASGQLSRTTWRKATKKRERDRHLRDQVIDRHDLWGGEEGWRCGQAKGGKLVRWDEQTSVQAADWGFRPSSIADCICAVSIQSFLTRAQRTRQTKKYVTQRCLSEMKERKAREEKGCGISVLRMVLILQIDCVIM